jgi:anti-anti-sigma regulatory factor
MSTSQSLMSVAYRAVGDSVTAVDLAGVLDASTYLIVRDSIIKAAVEQPELIVVHLDHLIVPTASALAVLTSARWHVANWPGVPIVLVTAKPEMRNMLQNNGITRFLTCMSNQEEASTVVRDAPRRHAFCDLEAAPAMARAARWFAASTLADWEMESYVSIAKVIITELVENAASARSPVRVRIESRDDLVWIAVRDGFAALPVRNEGPVGTEQFSRFGLVTSLSRRWGAEPDIFGGRVVWAVVGSENRL